MSSSIFDSICSRVEWCRREVLDAVLELAVEIAREGREGRRIGTLFTLGHADAVLAHSRPLILDPLSGHAPIATHVTDPNLRGTVKELHQHQTQLRGRVSERHAQDLAILTADAAPADERATKTNRDLDETLEESFPGSDAPGWTPVVGVKTKERQ